MASTATSGGKEPLQEQEPPRAPEASVGSTDNAVHMQAAPAERPDGGKEPPQKQEPPRAPEASVGSADNAEPMQVAPAGGSEGVEAVKIKIRRNALTHQRECVVLLHREGGGGEPEEREEDSESACSVGSESLSAPSPDIPAADLLEFLEATVHRRDKVQLALDKWGDFQRILTSVRSFLRASHANKTSGSNVHIRARKLHDQLVSFGRTQDLP
ncbi:UNVERIFIED_CONTAM: hypothetical protein FKN15_075287 [Acipenser sinensis]